jgi:hypothetical protein
MDGAGSGITSDIAEFKGWPKSWRDIPALVGLAALFEQARDYYEGIMAGLGGGAADDARAIIGAGQSLNPPGGTNNGVWQKLTPEEWDALWKAQGIGDNARGTDFWRGGPTWVGEEGPEIVVPPEGSQILSNEKSQAMGGPTIYIAAGAIVVYAADPEQAGIGVLSKLRGLGVPVGV